jgi:fatty-acyl-CoA synthase
VLPERIAAMLRVAGASALICESHDTAALASAHGSLADPRQLLEAGSLLADHAAAPEPELAGARDVCFLQFTSGSTAQPKGVIVSHANLAANARLILHDSVPINEDDRVLSWLPLYHDMGLVGMFLAPLLHRLPVAFLPTARFMRSPASWLEAASALRATITYGPSFAFALAMRRARDPHALDLSALRVVGCGGEPVQPHVMRKFAETFAVSGLDPSALTPSYGMAEATLAMTFSPPGRGLHTFRIRRKQHERRDREELPAGREGAVREVTSCGRTAPDHRVRILDAAGKALPEGCEGEIAFAGPSVTCGYYGNTPATAEVIVGGELRTGDLGFLDHGELFISGRKKDLIILNGRNHCPQDIEWAIAEVDGVRAGGVAAFSVDGSEGESAVALVEYAGGDARAATRQIGDRVNRQTGVLLEQIVLVAPGSLPRTTSGKLQRRLAKQRWLDGGLRQRKDRSEVSAPGPARAAWSAR